MKPVTTVLLDADGVIQFPGPFFEHLRQSYGWPRGKCRDFFAHLFERCPGYHDSLEGKSEFLPVLSGVLRAFDWPGAPEDFVRAWFEIGIAPDAVNLGLVAELRRHSIVCALASNQETGRARFMDEELGYRKLFDHRFYSSELGCKKPDPAYFRRVLALLGADADSVLFIDDRLRNVEAARRCGLRAEVHRRRDALARLLVRHSLPVPPRT